MRLSRWMPVLVFLAGAKLLFTGTIFYLYQAGELLWEPESALARATKPQETLPTCPPEIFASLRAERQRLQQEALALEKKKKDLALLQDQVNKRLASLSALEEEISRKLEELKTIKTKRFKLLVGAYANMKPSKAARLLAAMDQDMAIKILSALKTDQVARILSSMPPEKAASLAEALSGLPPKEL